MNPIRVDLTIALARDARRPRPARRAVDAARRHRRRPADRCTTPRLHRGGDGRQRRPRRRSTSRAGSAPTTTRPSPGCTRRRPARRRRERRGGPPGVDRRRRPRRQHRRRPAPRDARPGQRLLRLQRRGGGDPLAAGPRRASGSPTSTSTCTTATACEQIFYDDPRVLTISPARDRPDALPGHRLPGRLGWPGCAGLRGQRRAAARAPATRAGCGPSTPSCRRCVARVRARRPGDPARLRHPPRRPAGPPGAQRRRPARELPGPARPGPRGCGGKWVAIGGGGYAVVDVVPRAWTHLLADRRPGTPLDPAAATPDAWRACGQRAARRPRPVADDRRPHAGLPRLVRGLRPRHLAGPGHRTPPARRSSRRNGLVP